MVLKARAVSRATRIVTSCGAPLTTVIIASTIKKNDATI